VERGQEQISLAMLAAGLAAFREWNPDEEEPSALVWAILSRGLSARDLGFQHRDEVPDRG
jgi:hypothetical protein